MSEDFVTLLLQPNTQWVLFGTLLLGFASGILGSFSLLRKQSLIGDAVAHAALPGICVAYLIIGEKSLSGLLIGAAISGLIGTYCIQFIVRKTSLKEDTALCLILSVFFGFGIVLLTRISQIAGGNKSGLDDFIFGQAASMVSSDVKLMSIIALVIVIITLLIFKELKVMTFDFDFAKGYGLPTRFLNFVFLSLLVIVIVIGIQAVGVILMAALLIIPSISARYWTDSLSKMVIISGMFGSIAGVSGTIISTLGDGLPTGPFIVVNGTIIFIFSMLFAPNRGLIMKWIKRELFHKKLREQLSVQEERSRG